MVRLTAVLLAVSLVPACKSDRAPEPAVQVALGECTALELDRAGDPPVPDEPADGGPTLGALLGDAIGDLDDTDGNPGLGVSGTGLDSRGAPGTLPPDFGTIGGGAPSSRYARPSTQPSIRSGKATVEGALDEPLVRRFFRRELSRVRHCYQNRLEVDRTLRGLVTIEIDISGSGSVTGARASGVDDQLAACIVKRMKRIEFPAPKDGEPVRAIFPVHLSPPTHQVAGGIGEPLTAPTTGLGSAADAGPAPADAAPSPEPGLDSPLRARAGDLERCLTGLEPAAGTAHLEVTIDQQGAVSGGRLEGLDGKPAACIVELARGVRWPDARPGTYRCPLSWSARR